MRSGLELPSAEVILQLHQELLEEHGGAEGLRDRESLDAALARPLQLLAYSERGSVTVFELAAALAVSIVRRHPFVDGNKRASFMALGITLGLNGCYLDVTEQEATTVMLSLAAGTVGEEDFATWVERNSYEFS